MPAFFIILFGTYLGGNLYIFLKALQAMATLPLGLKIALSVIYWLCAISFLSIIILKDLSLPTSILHLIHEIGTGWLVFTLYMVLLLILTDILKLFHVQFAYGFHVAFTITIVALVYGYFNYKHPKIEVVNIVINKEVPTFQQLKILAISDIHLGYGTTKAELKKYVEKINHQQADLILISGDLIDNNVEALYQQKMQEELSELKAPSGIYMVPGNHEYISGIEASIKFIEQTPIQLLKDSVLVIGEQLQIIGRDDKQNRNRLPLSQLVKQTDPSKPIILLDHQPYKLEEAADNGIDLQFSGHTHRGQIWPISLLTDRLFELSHGYLKKKNTHFYTSSGLSLWGPPFRIGTNSELVVFNIEFK